MDFNCRESLIALFKNAAEEGLNPTDFESKKIHKLEQSVNTVKIEGKKIGSAEPIMIAKRPLTQDG